LTLPLAFLADAPPPPFPVLAPAAAPGIFTPNA
jgi:hypothetical protein